MKKVEEINLKNNNAELYALEYFDEPKGENQEGNDIFFNEDKTEFYIFEVSLAMYGILAIEQAINEMF